MKTLQEINKGCGKEFGHMNDYICQEGINSLCPQCQALKNQTKGIIKHMKLCIKNCKEEGNDEDILCYEDVIRILKGEKEE